MKFSLPVIFLAIAAGVSAQDPAPPANEAPAPTSGPDLPEAPDVPEAPDTPEAPDAPDVPEPPTAPEAPKAPDASVAANGGTGACAAENIVTRCLETEQAKVDACDPTDYDCQCAAYEAVATCYNNCPDDPRSFPAQNQVLVYCQQASRTTPGQTPALTPTNAYSTPKATNELEATPTESEDAGAASSTASERGRATNTGTFESGNEEGAAPDLMRNTGGMLLGVAGVMAIIL